MEKNKREIFISMDHQEYMDYMKSNQLMDGLLQEIEKLKKQNHVYITVKGAINISAEETGPLDNLSFEITGDNEIILEKIRNEFRNEARIERFSNNMDEIQHLKKNYADLGIYTEKLEKQLESIPKWIRSIFKV